MLAGKIALVTGSTSGIGLGMARALATKTPEMLASLAGIVTHWRDDADAKIVLAVAAESNDPEIVDIMARRVGTP